MCYHILAQEQPQSEQPQARHQVRVDCSERHAALCDLVHQCPDFEVRMERLAVGDYSIDGGVVIERKTSVELRC